MASVQKLFWHFCTWRIRKIFWHIKETFNWSYWSALYNNKLKSLKVAKLKDEDGCEGDDDGGDEGCDEDGDEGWMIDSETLGGLVTD